MKTNILVLHAFLLTLVLSLSLCSSRDEEPKPQTLEEIKNQDSLFRIAIKPVAGKYRNSDITDSLTISKVTDTTFLIGYSATIDTIKSKTYASYIFASDTVFKNKGIISDTRKKIDWPIKGGDLYYNLSDSSFRLRILDTKYNVYGNRTLHLIK